MELSCLIYSTPRKQAEAPYLSIIMTILRVFLKLNAYVIEIK